MKKVVAIMLGLLASGSICPMPDANAADYGQCYWNTRPATRNVCYRCCNDVAQGQFIYAYIATYAGGIAADLITSAYNSCLSSCHSLAIINANKQNMYVPQPPPRGVIPPVGGSRWP